MPPGAPPLPPFSPSELSYLHSSLSLHPPIRPDARHPTTFRPLSAETDLLPAVNGSARLVFEDGTEAIVGVRGEIVRLSGARGDNGQREGGEDGEKAGGGKVEVSIDVPGQKEDDGMGVFLGEMVREGLVAAAAAGGGGEGGLEGRLGINRGWGWGVYVDILLLSPPHTYPLPLLSLTTHLALLSTRLPALVSKGEEDPLCDDDWEAAVPLYGGGGSLKGDFGIGGERPPITLLVMAVGDNIFFDPSREELAVADVVLAVTIAPRSSLAVDGSNLKGSNADLQVLAVRTIDPPSRLSAATSEGESEDGSEEGVWRPRRGGVGRELIRRMVGMCIEKGGVGEEVLRGLQAFI